MPAALLDKGSQAKCAYNFQICKMLISNLVKHATCENGFPLKKEKKKKKEEEEEENGSEMKSSG